METKHKGYIVYGDGTFGLTLIKVDGKGSVPTVLSGSYTSPLNAMRDIDSYVTKKENTPPPVKKVKLNATAKGAGRV